MKSSRFLLLAAVLAVAAATTVSAAAPQVEFLKAANAIRRGADLASVNANNNAKMLNSVMHLKNLHSSRNHRAAADVRGRMLAQTQLCEYDKESRECQPGDNAMKDFKPETPEGQNLVDTMFKPELECMVLKTEASCKANPKCDFHSDDSSCSANQMALMAPPAVCPESDKTPVTATTLMMEKGAICQAISDEKTCNAATKDDCAFSNGSCNFDASKLMTNMMTDSLGPNSFMAQAMQLDKIADKCKTLGIAPSPPPMMNAAPNATNATNATAPAPAPAPAPKRMLLQDKAFDPAASCKSDADCQYDAAAKECGMTEATLMKIMGTEKGGMGAMQTTMMKCIEADSKACPADPKCEVDEKGACFVKEDAMIAGMFGEMKDGPYKTIIVNGFKCDAGDSSNVTKATCDAKKIEGCTYTGTGCTYNPPASTLGDIFTAPVPGYAPRCPSLMDKAMKTGQECFMTEPAKCNSNSKCMVETDQGQQSCTAKPELMFTAMAGEKDGRNMMSMMAACEVHTGNQGSCEAQTMDVDFFGRANPSKKKVTTAMSFKGVTKVDEATATKMKKAIAGSLGDDVKAEDITFTKVHFPVKAELKLTKTMTEVNADKPAFEKKFKKGVAADLGVVEGDINIRAISESPESRRRGLLAAGVNVAFTVENAKDDTAASAISKTISNAAALTAVAAETGASATVAAAPSYELEVEMEVAVPADKADTVSTKISDTGAIVNNLAAEGITATVTITEAPTVRDNTYVATDSSGVRVRAVFGAVVAVLGAMILF